MGIQKLCGCEDSLFLKTIESGNCAFPALVHEATIVTDFFKAGQVMELGDHEDRSPSCEELSGFNAAHGEWGIKRSRTMRRRRPASGCITTRGLGRHVGGVQDFEPETIQEWSLKKMDNRKETKKRKP